MGLTEEQRGQLREHLAAMTAPRRRPCPRCGELMPPTQTFQQLWDAFERHRIETRSHGAENGG